MICPLVCSCRLPGLMEANTLEWIVRQFVRLIPAPDADLMGRLMDEQGIGQWFETSIPAPRGQHLQMLPGNDREAKPSSATAASRGPCGRRRKFLKPYFLNELCTSRLKESEICKQFIVQINGPNSFCRASRRSAAFSTATFSTCKPHASPLNRFSFPSCLSSSSY